MGARYAWASIASRREQSPPGRRRRARCRSVRVTLKLAAHTFGYAQSTGATHQEGARARQRIVVFGPAHPEATSRLRALTPRRQWARTIRFANRSGQARTAAGLPRQARDHGSSLSAHSLDHARTADLSSAPAATRSRAHTQEVSDGPSETTIHWRALAALLAASPSRAPVTDVRAASFTVTRTDDTGARACAPATAPCARR